MRSPVANGCGAPFLSDSCSFTSTATTCAGLAVDARLRVVGADGRPVGGLFAAGEVLGREVLSGDAFVGGMSLTPAVAFGRRIGETWANS